MVHWDLRESMREADLQILLEGAKEKYPEARRIISDNGLQFIAREFQEFIRISGMTHVRTSPYYPQSNGKTERWHKSLKAECIRPGTPLALQDARRLIQRYVDHYNTVRLHSAIGFVTPQDMLAGRQAEIHSTRDRKLEQTRWRAAEPRHEEVVMNRTSIFACFCAALLIWLIHEAAGRAWAQTAVITTVVGTGVQGFSGDGGPATAARLNFPSGIASDSGGNLYICDTGNLRVRKVTPAGVIATVAGDGRRFYSGDNVPATLTAVSCADVAVDGAGNLYIADSFNNRVRRVGTDGMISTVPWPGQGQVQAVALSLDAAGNLYVGEFNRVSRRTPQGSVSTVVDLDTEPLVFITDIVSDSLGNLWIADAGTHRIWRVTTAGASTTVVGSGNRPATGGFGGDGGPATAARLNSPAEVALDGTGNLYIADSLNHRVRKVDPQGIITTVAGGGQVFGDGGPATAAQLNNPSGVVVDTAGNLYIADRDNNRIRKVALQGGSPSPQVSQAGVVNAASFVTGPVAPGQIITIFGSGIGPPTLATLRIGSSGRVDSALAETRVLFDGIPAPLVYASAAQTSAIVPYGLAGRASTQLQVEYRGARSNGVALQVAASAPGLFTLDASGRGQGAILNQDFSINSPTSPAEKGSVVVLYGTGEGQTEPPGVDGQITGEILSKPRLPVSVTIGGVPAEVLYAGAAPGLVAGVLQVNARVPDSVAAGSAVAVVLNIGGANSQPTATLLVR